MPERILRDWTDSEKFDGVSAGAETLFTRLLMKVDDYGRYTADPQNIRGTCYPRSESMRANTVDAWLKELSDHHLVLCYQVGGKRFLAIINFRQRLRNPPPKPKFPPVDGKPMEFRPDDGDWRAWNYEETKNPLVSGGSPRPAANGGESRPYSYADANAKSGASAYAESKDYPLLKASGKGGSGEKPRQPAAGQSANASSLLMESNLRGVAVRIVNNVDGWHYDNCKAPRTFTLGEIELILRENVGRVTTGQCVVAWQKAVTATHQRIVDSHENEQMKLPDKPEAYVKTMFRFYLKDEKSATGQKQIVTS